MLAPSLVVFSRVVRPVIAVLNWVANMILRLFRVEPKDEATSTYTLEEVAGIVAQSRREGTLEDHSGTLAGAFEFTDKTVHDIDIPLDKVVMLPAGVTPAQVQDAVLQHGHSRYVITNETAEPSGYLHMKDVMDIGADGFDQPVPAKRIRRLIAIPRSADIEDALARMRQQGVHVAQTVADDGAILGILFLEDMLEVLVGEVNDATAA
jgi:CBS domain containing-hemolysin-like protein